MDNLIAKILKDLKVELLDEFDKNFQRSAFFTHRWPARKSGDQENKKGTEDSTRKLLIRTGKLRRSISAKINGTSISFTSSEDYASAHNEGTKTAGRGNHTVIPQRQFVGFSKETDKIVRDTISRNTEELLKSIIDGARQK